jgi:hypothetical protein
MKNSSIAMGLTTAAIASLAGGAEGCGQSSPDANPDQVHHVGIAGWVQWVQIEELAPGTEYRRTNNCIMERGGELLVKNGDVFYRNSHGNEPGGTDCPNDVQVDMSPRDAEREGEDYQDYTIRKQEVKREVRELEAEARLRGRPVGKPFKIRGQWAVPVVNPKPITGTGRYDTPVRYGDDCLVAGKVEELGHLASGEEVLRLQDLPPGRKGPYSTGVNCPDGTVYLAPPPNGRPPSDGWESLYATPQARADLHKSFPGE